MGLGSLMKTERIIRTYCCSHSIIDRMDSGKSIKRAEEVDFGTDAILVLL